MGRSRRVEVKAMKSNIRLSLAALVLLTGCGAGNEPMSILGDPSQSLGAAVGLTGPGLAMPLSATAMGVGGYTSQGFIPYSTSTPYIALQNTLFSTQTTILAPGTGLVVDISNQGITIFHNAHVISKVTGIINTVQVGAYVTLGSVVGTAIATAGFGSNPIIKFYVYADGLPVCPLTYLNEAGRLQLKAAISYAQGSGYTGIGNPCI